MDLDELIIAMYVKIDDELKALRRQLPGERLRRRGPAPKLSDAEALAMECAGEFLGLDCDKRIFAYFRRHWLHFFPAAAQVTRTTFARQAANLWRVKEAIWRRLADDAASESRLQIVDSMPMPVCRFARASFCRVFRGAARYGRDHSDRQTFYGFRLHARIALPGFISELFVAPANQSEQSILPPLAESAPAGCAILGDRNYCVPQLKERLAADGLLLLTPPARQAKNDPEEARGRKWPWSDLRYRIDAVFGQLTDRLHIKSVRARDLWHLTSRIYRKALAHTLAVILNIERGKSPLQFDKLAQI